MKLFPCNPPPSELRNLSGYASCDCFRPLGDSAAKWTELEFHDDVMPADSPAAAQLEQLIRLTVERGSESFVPRNELGGELWSQIKRLPASIGLMNRVTRMDLYASHLVAIPREIMLMTSLVNFDPYTSYRLHWLPYELARCPALRTSRISTRALYGNRNYRPPFPRLPNASVSSEVCSICDGNIERGKAVQRWISLLVATDVVPLLVNACSGSCLDRLPAPPPGCAARAHKGGVGSRPPKLPSS